MALYAPWCPRDQPSLSSSSLSSPPPLQCKYRSTKLSPNNREQVQSSQLSASPAISCGFLISPPTTLIVCLLKFPILIFNLYLISIFFPSFHKPMHLLPHHTHLGQYANGFPPFYFFSFHSSSFKELHPLPLGFCTAPSFCNCSSPCAVLFFCSLGTTQTTFLFFLSSVQFLHG